MRKSKIQKMTFDFKHQGRYSGRKKIHKLNENKMRAITVIENCEEVDQYLE